MYKTTIIMLWDHRVIIQLKGDPEGSAWSLNVLREGSSKPRVHKSPELIAFMPERTPWSYFTEF